MEVKRIKNSVVIYEFLFTFSYETRKGYYREQQRWLKHISLDAAKYYFKMWIKNQRTMFNAKILSIVETDKKEIIEL